MFAVTVSVTTRSDSPIMRIIDKVSDLPLKWNIQDAFPFSNGRSAANAIIDKIEQARDVEFKDVLQALSSRHSRSVENKYFAVFGELPDGDYALALFGTRDFAKNSTAAKRLALNIAELLNKFGGEPVWLGDEMTVCFMLLDAGQMKREALDGYIEAIAKLAGMHHEYETKRKINCALNSHLEYENPTYLVYTLVWDDIIRWLTQ